MFQVPLYLFFGFLSSLAHHFLTDSIIKPTLYMSQESNFSEQSAFFRQTLELEVKSYRDKIAYYQQLEQEINDISESIVSKGQDASSKNRDSAHKKYTQSDSKASSLKRNSNKKIKLYELQKKLRRFAAELKQKSSAYQKHRQRQEELIRQIEAKSKRIDEEKLSSERLMQLERKISADIELITEKVFNEACALEESVKKKELFNFERRKIRDQLRKLRSSIERPLSGRKKQRQEVSLSMSEGNSDFGLKWNEAEQPQEADSSTLDRNWVDRQRNRIQVLLSKLDLQREKNNEALIHFYSLRRDFSNNEILAKHHRLTNSIQSTQLKKYESIINESKIKIQSVIEETELVSDKLRRVEGEGGYLRGRAGVVMEQQRLVAGVNVLLEQSGEQLREKCEQLRGLKKLFLLQH